MPAPNPEAIIVDSAADVLGQIMSIPGRAIPGSLLAKAEGIAIIPGMLKGGFIIGVSRGRGVVVTRDETGKWRLPMFVQMTGASFGWQAGIEDTDLVLVFRTKTSLQNLMRSKITIGANASAAAGPVGRSAQAATDASLRAEILSYSRSRGSVCRRGAGWRRAERRSGCDERLLLPARHSTWTADRGAGFRGAIAGATRQVYDRRPAGPSTSSRRPSPRRRHARSRRSAGSPRTACRVVAATRRGLGHILANLPRPACRSLRRRPSALRRGPSPFAQQIRDRRRRFPLPDAQPASRVPNDLVPPPPVLRHCPTGGCAAIGASATAKMSRPVATGRTAQRPP